MIRLEDAGGKVTDSVFVLANDFANRTGGMTADLWGILPGALSKLDAAKAMALLESSAAFLEFGGSVTLHFVTAGGEVLASADAAFDDWCRLSRAIARYGNAVLISFLRAITEVLSPLKQWKERVPVDDVRRVLQLTEKIASTDAESALAAFKSSAGAKESFDRPVRGMGRDRHPRTFRTIRQRPAAATLPLRPVLRTSVCKKRVSGCRSKSVQSVLRMYIEALTGNEIEVALAGRHARRIQDRRRPHRLFAVGGFCF